MQFQPEAEGAGAEIFAGLDVDGDGCRGPEVPEGPEGPQFQWNMNEFKIEFKMVLGCPFLSQM